MPWTPERAWEWYRARPIPFGFNYVPSTAVNSTEMWQRETFDPDTIERELGWAEAIGFNSCRVFLQFLVWQDDPDGLAGRFDRFLSIAERHHLTVLPILFDDCAFAGKQPYLGPQDAPVPGVHNSGWTASPGSDRVRDRAQWPALEAYVTALVSGFGRDGRVLAWDLYNEPGNSGMGLASLPLAEAAFAWARAAGPEQPLMTGVWSPDADFTDLNMALLRLSDVVSFHNYDPVEKVAADIARLRALGRPLLCTEWMRRHHANSLFGTHLPLFMEEQVGSYFWGLVNGRTQTHQPWRSPVGAVEPEEWFHDLLHPDGRPYNPGEMEVIRRYAHARPQ